MNIPTTIRTSFGPRALPRCPMARASLTSGELHVLIGVIGRETASAPQDGHQSVADHRAWRAAAFREAAW
jgi:hypothetical protein